MIDKRFSDDAIQSAVEFLERRSYAVCILGEANTVASVDTTSVDPSWLLPILRELQELRATAKIR